MKIQKIFTLDVELADKLKRTSNASGLVNELLTKHFSTDVLKALSPKDLARAREINQIQISLKKELKAFGIE